MTITLWLLCAVFTFLVTRLLHTIRRGPWEYGSVMVVAMGSKPIVFLSGLQAIRQYSMMEETSKRPPMPVLLDMYSEGKELGMGMSSGERWKRQRNFCLKTLKVLWGSSVTGLEAKIEDELIQTLASIEERVTLRGTVIDGLETMFDLPDLNIIWGLVAGRRYDYSDPRLKEQFRYLATLFGEPTVGPMTVLEGLTRIPPFSGILANIRVSMGKFRSYIRDVISDVLEDTTEEDVYIRLFLNEKGEYFNHEELAINIQDLFVGGTETTSKTLSFCVLWMILHPEIQSHLQIELDSFGPGLVRYEDKDRLPYTMACLMEVRRISTPFPVTPPRTADRDVIIQGYRIPAGTQVQMSLYSALMDPNCFQDPDQFNPERFLNSKGEISIPDGYIPFGYGKRRCPGEQLASVSNFLFFANLMKRFRFEIQPNSKKPSTTPMGGITFGPGPFSAYIKSRQSY